MRQFLSPKYRKFSQGAPSIMGANATTTFTAISYRWHSASMDVIPLRGLFVCLALFVSVISSAFAQHPIPTSRADNRRTNANTSETLLTPANVNKASFGRLFSAPVDYVVMAQPLYVPNVNIPGQGVHNVVYIVTQADSVYAIDADTGAQLWSVNFTNSSQGITTASGKNLPCGTAPGFNQEGIIGTPAIDSNTNTMYLVAKTVVNGTVQHNLHALDITTGNEQPHSPALIKATTVSNKGHKTVFNSLHQKNRPGLLLLNGILYLGFGSNYCNDSNSGWVLSYDPASLSQLAVFNTSPDTGLASIWQAGSGLAADDAGYIYVETAEAGNNQYDIQNGGQAYDNSVVKLNPDLTVADYFTPWDVTTLNTGDFDLSSTGALVLPDQNGPTPHELIAGGKYGVAYVLDRDNMGMFSNTGTNNQIIQEITLVQQNPNQLRDALFGSAAYWNNNVYFAANAEPVMAFPVLPSGLLGTPVKTAATYSGSHSPSVSANGNTNGVLWVISGGLNAFDAVTLKFLYNTSQAANSRDKLPPIGHFVTQTIANGKVYVATNNSLEAYGLFYSITVTGGGAQSTSANTALSAPILINVSNPYNGQPTVGATISFSDGCTKAGAVTCGTFNPGNGVGYGTGSITTDSNGNASISYTVPQKAGTFTLTATLIANGVAGSSTTTTATAAAGTPAKLVAYSGSNQTGTDGYGIAKPINALVQDVYKNGVPGVTLNFSANHGSTPNPSVVTDATGMAHYSQLVLPSTPTQLTVTAVAAPANPPVNLTPVKATYVEHSVAGVPTTIAVSSGNNQSDTSGSQLPQPLAAIVYDQNGNPFSGNQVTYSDNGAGGSFPNGSTAVTGANGIASVTYILPPSGGAVSVNAKALGVTTPAVFTENSNSPSATKVSVQNGNSQTGAAGTKLPQMLTALVIDQFNNPLPGDSVTFSDNGAGGSFPNGTTVKTDANGIATACYALPQHVAGVTIYAVAAGINGPAVFTQTAVAGPAANIAITGGNSQTAADGTQSPQALVIQVTDQYGNPVSGNSVGFSDGGAGGGFSGPNPGITDTSGTVSEYYTLPPIAGETIYIAANATGVANQVLFTEYGQ